MSKRNYNMDILRAFALLYVLIYHIWVTTGSLPVGNSILTMMISLGGEIGVTTFFWLSGYGIYCSLHFTENKEKVNYVKFIKKRLTRIWPQYLICLFIIMTVMDGVYYWNSEGLMNLVTHIFFIHNLFPNYFGAINGVLWTMGIIFQFYIVAIPLYKLVKKLGIFTGPLVIVLTIIFKMVTYRFVLPEIVSDTSLNFFAGRQLITALDNFVLGMVVADIIINCKKREQSYKYIFPFVISIVMLIIVSNHGVKFGIHTNNISGYMWHSEVALVISLVGFFITYIPIKREWQVSKIFLWISKYEYEIYLWHLVMINNIIQKSAWVQGMISAENVFSLYIIFILLAIGMGYVFANIKVNSFVCKCKKAKIE